MRSLSAKVSIALFALSIGTSLIPVHTQAATTPMPSIDYLMAPRVIGQSNAQHSILLAFSPMTAPYNQFFIENYENLLRIAQSGHAKIEVRIIAHTYFNIAVALTARCLDADAYFPFLYYATKNSQVLQKYSSGAEEAVKQAVLTHPEFWPKGLNAAQTEQRLAQCNALRSNFILLQEQQRFQINYDFNIGHPDPGPILIFDNGRRVFKGITTREFSTLFDGN